MYSASSQRELRTDRPPATILALAVALLVALGAACGALPGNGDVRSAGPHPFEVTVTLPEQGPEEGLDVRYTLRQRPDLPLPDTLEFVLPVRWAGRDGFDRDLRDFDARAEDGRPLLIEFLASDRIAIHREGAEAVDLRFSLRPRARQLTEATRYTAIAGGGRVFAPGFALLLQPDGLPRPYVEAIRLHLRAPEGARLLATASTDRDLPIEQLVNAAWFGGAFRHAQRVVRGNRVDVWIEASLELPAAQLAARTGEVVGSQARLLGTSLSERTRVVVLRRDDRPDARTGSAVTGGFVLELGDAATRIDDDLTQLVAHENLHRLNGHLLRLSTDAEYAALWFKEGVTEYLAARLLVDAGLVTPDHLLARLAEALTMYDANPASVTVQAETLGERFWDDRDYRRLPYDKGALLGLLVDLELQRDGAGSLAGWLEWLALQPDAASMPLDNTSLRVSLERYSARSWRDFWARYVEGTDRLPVFEQLDAAGLDIVERVEPAPFFGFRANVTADGRWYVAEVTPGSPAARAGLVEGMALAGEPWIPLRGGPHVIRVAIWTSQGPVALPVASATGQRRVLELRVRDRASFLARFRFETRAP